MRSMLLAWNNTFQNVKRTTAAVAGISFSILLIFMQLGFLNGSKLASSGLYHYFSFDLVIVASKFLHLGAPVEFQKTRLLQATTVPGVKDIFVLNVAPGTWKDPRTGIRTYMRLLGIDPKPEFILDPEIINGLDAIEQTNTVLIDRLSHKDYGDISVGQKAEINGTEIKIGGQFKLGMIFFAEGWAVTSNSNYTRLTYRDPRSITYGLISVDDPKNVQAVKQELKRRLPGDVVVYDRDELIRREQKYFINVKPVGIVFKLGVLVSYLIGVVILFQILSTDISTRLKEYATLKALGFSSWYINSIGVGQALLMASLSYIPALGFAAVVFKIVYKLSNLPMRLTPGLALFVLLLSLTMSGISSLIALQKVKKADPAELF